MLGIILGKIFENSLMGWSKVIYYFHSSLINENSLQFELFQIVFLTVYKYDAIGILFGKYLSGQMFGVAAWYVQL